VIDVVLWWPTLLGFVGVALGITAAYFVIKSEIETLQLGDFEFTGVVTTKSYHSVDVPGVDATESYHLLGISGTGFQ
jgi:hypothetical protein